MQRTIAALSLAALAACATAQPGTRAAGTTAAAAPRAGTFYVVQRGDTIASERFTRSATRLDAQLGRKAGPSLVYGADLAADASVTRLEARTYVASDTAPQQRSVATFRGDSVIVEVMGAGARTNRMATTRGVVPYVNPSPSLLEQILRRGRVLGGDSVAVPILVVGGGQTLPADVRFMGADSAVIFLGPVQVRARTDRSGALLGGTVPSQEIVITRTQ
jgi:hypothetical protein